MEAFSSAAGSLFGSGSTTIGFGGFNVDVFELAGEVVGGLADMKQSRSESKIMQGEAEVNAFALETDAVLEKLASSEASIDRVRRVREIVAQQRAFFGQDGAGGLSLGTSRSVQDDTFAQAARETDIDRFNADVRASFKKGQAGRVRLDAKNASSSGFGDLLGRVSNLFDRSKGGIVKKDKAPDRLVRFKER